MPPLSNKQRWVLASLSRIPHGRGEPCWAHGRATVASLKKRGLVEDIGPDRSGRSGDYIARITVAGREALNNVNGGDDGLLA